MTPTQGGGGNFRVKSVKLLYFLKIFKKIFKKEESSKIVNFMNPRDRGFCVEAWPYKSYSENALLL